MMAICYILAILLHVAVLAAAKTWNQGFALLASYDFLLVIAGSLSPLLQVIYQRTMHHSFNNLHMHRTLSVAGLSFTIVHIVLSSRYKTDSWGWNLSSGSFASASLAASGIVGVLLSRSALLRPILYRFLSLFHVPLGMVGLLALFSHRFTDLKSIQDFLFLGEYTLITSCFNSC